MCFSHSNSIQDSFHNCTNFVVEAPTVFVDQLKKIPNGLERAVGSIRDGLTEKVAPPIIRGASNVAGFVKRNWKPLIAYIIAWGVIITSTGLMYGFEVVAIPLTIGFVGGMVFGIIAGILIVKVIDPSGKISLWNLLNSGIEKHLDPNGTRPIVISVAVTVLLAAAVVFPYVLGAIFGIFVGNQLAVKGFTGRDLGKDPAKDLSEIEILKNKISELEKEVRDHKKVKVADHDKMIDQLELLIEQLREAKENCGNSSSKELEEEGMSGQDSETVNSNATSEQDSAT